MSHWSQPQILHLSSPYVPVGVLLYSDRLAGTVCDGIGLSGRQRVAWTREAVVDGVSCLFLDMLVQVLCEQVEMLY